MEGISFDEETSIAPTPAQRRTNSLVAFVLSSGFAKNEREANRLLLWGAIAGVAFAFSLVIWVGVNQPSGLGKDDIQRIIQLQGK